MRQGFLRRELQYILDGGDSWRTSLRATNSLVRGIADLSSFNTFLEIGGATRDTLPYASRIHFRTVGNDLLCEHNSSDLVRLVL